MAKTAVWLLYMGKLVICQRVYSQSLSYEHTIFRKWLIGSLTGHNHAFSLKDTNNADNINCNFTCVKCKKYKYTENKQVQ